ncbi:Nuclear receptor 2C2-associated protein [Phlyctochytrium bullatum]|nr:Nuclear receptor 2C2-associated protein [Phlyctochytrium bullatum]
MAPSIIDGNDGVQLKVSSVLNRDTKNFGKQFLIDRDEETCWNSDQGQPQWIMVDFGSLVKVEKISIMFQGGFASQVCQVLVQEAEAAADDAKSVPWKQAATFYPDDINSRQAVTTPTYLPTLLVGPLHHHPAVLSSHGQKSLQHSTILGDARGIASWGQTTTQLDSLKGANMEPQHLERRGGVLPILLGSSTTTTTTSSSTTAPTSTSTLSTFATTSTSITTTTTKPTSTTTSTQQPSGSSGISSGLRLGLIIGGVVLALVIIAILAACCLSRRRRKDAGGSPKQDSVEKGNGSVDGVPYPTKADATGATGGILQPPQPVYPSRTSSDRSSRRSLEATKPSNEPFLVASDPPATDEDRKSDDITALHSFAPNASASKKLSMSGSSQTLRNSGVPGSLLKRDSVASKFKSWMSFGSAEAQLDKVSNQAIEKLTSSAPSDAELRPSQEPPPMVFSVSPEDVAALFIGVAPVKPDADVPKPTEVALPTTESPEVQNKTPTRTAPVSGTPSSIGGTAVDEALPTNAASDSRPRSLTPTTTTASSSSPASLPAKPTHPYAPETDPISLADEIEQALRRESIASPSAMRKSTLVSVSVGAGGHRNSVKFAEPIAKVDEFEVSPSAVSEKSGMSDLSSSDDQGSGTGSVEVKEDASDATVEEVVQKEEVSPITSDPAATAATSSDDEVVPSFETESVPSQVAEVEPLAEHVSSQVADPPADTLSESVLESSEDSADAAADDEATPTLSAIEAKSVKLNRANPPASLDIDQEQASSGQLSSEVKQSGSASTRSSVAQRYVSAVEATGTALTQAAPPMPNPKTVAAKIASSGANSDHGKVVSLYGVGRSTVVSRPSVSGSESNLANSAAGSKASLAPSRYVSATSLDNFGTPQGASGVASPASARSSVASPALNTRRLSIGSDGGEDGGHGQPHRPLFTNGGTAAAESNSYIALHDFSAGLRSDEIHITAGDLVQVLERYDDGWAKGVNLSQNKHAGMFPLLCLKRLTSGKTKWAKAVGEAEEEEGPNELEDDGRGMRFFKLPPRMSSLKAQGSG